MKSCFLYLGKRFDIGRIQSGGDVFEDSKLKILLDDFTRFKLFTLRKLGTKQLFSL